MSCLTLLSLKHFQKLVNSCATSWSPCLLLSNIILEWNFRINNDIPHQNDIMFIFNVQKKCFQYNCWKDPSNLPFKNVFQTDPDHKCLDFGDIIVGSSSSRRITIYNNSNCSLQFKLIIDFFDGLQTGTGGAQGSPSESELCWNFCNI